MDQSAMDKRYGEDGKRTNICFTCNRTGHWARNGPDKEKQTGTFVFVYVDPYSHELKISTTMGPAKEFQHLKFVGALKSFCNEHKMNSPQNTISVESQTENMQIDNTSISDSEICQTAEQMEKEIIKSQSNANQINYHLSSKKDLSTSEEKQQSNEEKKKKNCYKSKKHGNKTCPDITLKKNTRKMKRKSDGESGIPKKKKKNSKWQTLSKNSE